MGHGEQVGRPVVVCNRPLLDDVQQQRLESLCRVRVVSDDAELAGSLADAVGAIIIRPTEVTASLLDCAPHLRVLATVSSGVDHVDVAALEARGIELVAGGGAAPTAVAEWVLWAILSQRRGLAAIARRTAETGFDDWGGRLTGYVSRESAGLAVGIVGFGNIGREVHRLLEPFGPRVLVFDPAQKELPPGCTFVDDVRELCERSEVVTVHVPLNASTRGLLGMDELRLIGSGGMVINAARGGIVDQEALVASLDAGTLGAAAIDTFDPEPIDEAIRRRLAASGRALLTPHVAGVSVDGLAALCRRAVDGIAEHLRIGQTDEPCPN